MAGYSWSFQDLYFIPAAGVSSRSISQAIDFSDTFELIKG